MPVLNIVLFIIIQVAAGNQNTSATPIKHVIKCYKFKHLFIDCELHKWALALENRALNISTRENKPVPHFKTLSLLTDVRLALG